MERSWKSNTWTELTEYMEWGILYQQGTLVDPISSIMDQKRRDDLNRSFSVRNYITYIWFFAWELIVTVNMKVPVLLAVFFLGCFLQFHVSLVDILVVCIFQVCVCFASPVKSSPVQSSPLLSLPILTMTSSCFQCRFPPAEPICNIAVGRGFQTVLKRSAGVLTICQNKPVGTSVE